MSAGASRQRQGLRPGPAEYNVCPFLEPLAPEPKSYLISSIVDIDRSLGSGWLRVLSLRGAPLVRPESSEGVEGLNSEDLSLT